MLNLSLKELKAIAKIRGILLEKINTCHNNPKKSSAIIINKHTSFDTILFDITKNNLYYYRC